MKKTWPKLAARSGVYLIGILAVFLCAVSARALVGTEQTGKWPKDWPQELDSLRSRARTIEIATGIQENIYEIRFDNRDEFLRAWPFILKLKTPGAPVTLCSTNNPGPKGTSPFFSTNQPVVRIYGPSESFSGGPSSGEARTAEAIARSFPQGKMLHAGPPWPEKIIGKDGSLPEYVVNVEINGARTWEPADFEKDKQNNKFRGFYHRARIELEVVLDDNVIKESDLHLPQGTAIRDQRR